MSEVQDHAADARHRIAALGLGFEAHETLRSALIRDIILMQVGMDPACRSRHAPGGIPRNLIRFWHDHSELPDDVAACMFTWERLADHGFAIRTFDDASADRYIRDRHGVREVAAFSRCAHPAMRCDYLRLCVLLTEGGLYVDCDDVLLDDGWTYLLEDDRLKLQPLCYDISAGGMMPNADIWRTDLPPGEHNFYVNNDPIAAPAGHPVLKRALERATELLLGGDNQPEIQATTGPGNLTTVLAAHAYTLILQGDALDFNLIRGWDAIAEMRWDLSYRGDERNWRNVYGC
ncbi:glycosyltransferase family 32 protein [Sphingomonas sp. NPDC092331]|uniref:glycosyltransferase family 32 protein n=1 Tax=unclassified Sphingomonas TaxID=196159 RepID=UPI0031F4E9FA